MRYAVTRQTSELLGLRVRPAVETAIERGDLADAPHPIVLPA